MHANNTAASIKPCSTSSPTWGVSFQTTEIMHINTNCLGNYNGQIKLGNCNKNTKQTQWKFQNQNRFARKYMKKILTAARIIAMSANYSLSPNRRNRRKNQPKIDLDLLYQPPHH